MKAQADSNSRGQKDFILEKRRERLDSGESRGTQKLTPWVRVGSGVL
jgi:hypothetical protein